MSTPASIERRKHAQRNRDSIFIEEGELLRVDAFAGDQFIQRIRVPQCAAAAKPGSFIHITCDATLPMRRPLSIMRAQDDWIEVLFKKVGDGMHALSKKRVGDKLSVLGPIGQPFNPDPEKPRALLIGGGVGIPPMVFLADKLRHDDTFEPLAILGSELPFPFELGQSEIPVAGIDADTNSTMPLMERWGIPARLTSLAGFDGCHRGYVTELAEQWLTRLSPEALATVKIFSCGPTPMLRAVADLAARYGVACEVSLEEFMACAVGGCAGCVVRIRTENGDAMQRVCVDGPVFDASSVAW